MHFPYFSLPVLYRKPFIITIHDLIIHHFATGKASTLPLPIYALKRLGYKKVLKHGILRAKRIIVPLETVREDIVNTFSVKKSRVVVTNEGFDTSLKKSDNISDSIKKIALTPFYL